MITKGRLQQAPFAFLQHQVQSIIFTFFAAINNETASIMLQQIAPYFGYLASLCLIIALLVNNDIQFRWFNAMGSTSFIIYALILHAFPVLLTNGILLCINIVYLVKLYLRREDFDLMEFKGDEKLALKFLQFYQKDIQAYFPHFEKQAFQNNLNFVVTRDLVIANIFSATLSPNGDATVSINYTLERYRDYKVGRFIFEKERDYLVSKGVQRIVYRTVPNPKHAKFLKVMGFQPASIEGNQCMVKQL